MNFVDLMTDARKEEILTSLSNIIVKNLQEEFREKKLSGNLINTIQIEISADEVKIHIPAKTYDMLLFQAKGVVVHDGRGSYASKLDTTGSEFYIYPTMQKRGSFLIKPHNHIGYIERIINKSIREWRTTLKGMKYVRREDI